MWKTWFFFGAAGVCCQQACVKNTGAFSQGKSEISKRTQINRDQNKQLSILLKKRFGRVTVWN